MPKRASSLVDIEIAAKRDAFAAYFTGTKPPACTTCGGKAFAIDKDGPVCQRCVLPEPSRHALDLYEGPVHRAEKWQEERDEEWRNE